MSDVQDLSLIIECHADQVHRLDGPLSVGIALMNLVQLEGLVLLFEDPVLPYVREEEAFAEVNISRVHLRNGPVLSFEHS